MASVWLDRLYRSLELGYFGTTNLHIQCQPLVFGGFLDLGGRERAAKNGHTSVTRLARAVLGADDGCFAGQALDNEAQELISRRRNEQ